jgi:predicted acetyltransferase
MDLQLVRPSFYHRHSFLALAQEFVDEGVRRYQAPLYDFEQYMFYLDEYATGSYLPQNMVRELSYWAIVDQQVVGTIRLRPELNSILERIGGHIGYDVRPSQRQRGYASEMLRQMLDIARSYKLKRVLLTCDATNTASIKVIRNNGGIFFDQQEYLQRKIPVQRYWIELEAQKNQQT